MHKRQSRHQTSRAGELASFAHLLASWKHFRSQPFRRQREGLSEPDEGVWILVKINTPVSFFSSNDE